MPALIKAFFASSAALLFWTPFTLHTHAFVHHSKHAGFATRLNNPRASLITPRAATFSSGHATFLNGSGTATSLSATGFGGSDNPIIGVEEMIAEMKKQAPADDFDMVGAEKAIREAYESYAMTPIIQKVADGDSALTLVPEDETVAILDSCDAAVEDFATDAIGLLLALSGVPSKITKTVARKIMRKAKGRLTNKLKSIARDFFNDAGNLFKVGSGLAAIASALMEVFSVGFIIDAIFGEMSWWEIASLSTWIAAQIAIIFFSGGSALAIKLLTVVPAVVDLCLSAGRVGTQC